MNDIQFKECLVINTWESRCGNCNESADPNELGHFKKLGYTPGQGCAIVWKYVASDYIGLHMKERCLEMRPDLEWIGFDEEQFKAQAI